MLTAFDTETHPIAPGMVAPKGVVLSMWADDGNALILFPQALGYMESWLRDSVTELVGHNVAYDLAVCCAERPSLLTLVFAAYEDDRMYDTMVRGKLIDIARGEHKIRTRDDGVKVKTLHSLAAMAKLYLGIDLKKEDTYRTRYHELDGIPLDQWPEEAKDYALKDAETTLAVYQAQEKYIQGSPLFGGILPDQHKQMRAAWVLHLMSVWGVITDGPAVAALKSKLQKQLDGAHEFLLQAGLIHKTGTKAKPKWSKDSSVIKQRIREGFEKHGKRVPLTDTGQVSTGDDAKIESGDSDLIKMASFTLAEKLLDSYIPLLERGTKTPINARWNVLLESGRVSCSDPNLLNPPAGNEGVRECFIPRPGYVYANADYATVELRALAQICLDLFGQSKLADAFRAGADPHANLAQSMGLSSDKDATIDVNGKKVSVRRFTKMMNFGFASGLGAETFIEYARGYDVKLDLQQSESARNKWFATWPEARAYFQWVSRQVPHDLATIVQHRSGRIRGGCKFTKAVNTHFQGLVADGSKEALWLMSKEGYCDTSSPLYGSRPVVYLYDEFILEVPELGATAAADRMVELMTRGMASVIPDIPIVVSDLVLMRRWSKEAESTRDLHGQLSIWG